MDENTKVLFTEEAIESVTVNTIRSGFDKDSIMLQFGADRDEDENENELLIISNINFVPHALPLIINHLQKIVNAYEVEYGKIDEE